MESPLDPQTPPEAEPTAEPTTEPTAEPTAERTTAWPESPAATEAEQPTHPHGFFMGRYGLRAGWGLLIFFVLLAAMVFSIRLAHDAATHTGYFAHKTHTAVTAKTVPAAKNVAPGKIEPLKGMIEAEGLVFAVLLFASWIMAKIERRRFSAFGLGGQRPFLRFAAGAFWGLLAIGLLVASLWVFGFLHFDGRLDHGPSILFWGVVQLFAFLLVGLFEEFLFRGYIQFTLTRGLVGLGKMISSSHPRVAAFWLASIITSAIFLFAHTHNAGEDKFGLFSVFIAGVVFVVALWRTGSLWWAIGFHMAWDWSQSFLYGVPDSGGLMQGRLFATHASGNPLLSGGSVGPEGSVLLVVPMTLAILVLLFWTRSSPQPSLETTAPPAP